MKPWTPLPLHLRLFRKPKQNQDIHGLILVESYLLQINKNTFCLISPSHLQITTNERSSKLTLKMKLYFNLTCVLILLFNHRDMRRTEVYTHSAVHIRR